MSTALWWAGIAALGTGLVVTAGRQRTVKGLAQRLTLRQVEERRPLVDRLFGAVAEDLLRRRKTQDLEIQLKQAGLWERPGSLYPNARLYYAYKLAVAALVGTLALGFGLVLTLLAQAPPVSSLLLGLGGTVLGFVFPDLDLQGQVKRRDDAMIADMATALDRLANFLAAGIPLPQAITTLATRPGGVFVAELRYVATQYNVTGDMVEAVDRMLERNGELRPLIPFTTLVKATTKMGGGVGESLRHLAAEMREELTQRITARGYRNTVLMIIPAFFAIIAMLLVLAAPGALRALAALGNGGF